MTEHTAAVPMVPPVPPSLEQRVMEWIAVATVADEEAAREVIALVRAEIARDIEAERDRLRQPPFPADVQWLRALESAAAIARGGAS